MTRVLIFLLVASLGANAALLVRRFSQPPPVIAPPGYSVSSGAAVRPVSVESPGVGSTTALSAATVPAWQAIGSRDLHTLVANLRATGFDDLDVHAIIRAIQLEQYASRRAAFLSAAGPRPYWLQQRGDGLSAAQRAELRDLTRAQEAELRDLLGEPPLSASERRTNIATYGPLPPEKIRVIKRIQADYADLSSEVFRERSSGPMMPWDSEKLAYIEAERRKDLEAALTPEEMEIYTFYGPGVASGMRSQLAGMDPTEAEFRAIHAVRADLETRFGGAMFGDASRAQQRSEAFEQSKRQIRAALGEERYAVYERVTDWGYRNASDIVARYNLPAENATATYEIGRDVQARAAALRADKTLTGSARQEASAALAREAQERLAVLLTPEGLSTYKNSGGNWLRNLENQGGLR